MFSRVSLSTLRAARSRLAAFGPSPYRASAASRFGGQSADVCGS